MIARAAAVAGLAGSIAACAPTTADTTTVVSGARLLAVQAAPPEAPTDGTFAMSALYVGPDGPLDASSLTWATCTLQNPLDQSGPINPACFVPASSGLLSLGSGGTVRGTIPANACELFGPESPPPLQGQPAARPTAPDATGGFYLPVRLDLGKGTWAAASERIMCQPANVSQPVFVAFVNGYHPNANPTVATLSLVDADGGAIPVEGGADDGSADGGSTDREDGAIAEDGAASEPVVVSPGNHVSLEVGWPECPTTPVCGDGICSAGETATSCPADCKTPRGCGGAETYLYIDTTTGSLTTRRESMAASFYATSGTFDNDSVGRSESDPTTNVTDGWTAPSTPGPVHVWVVLRDARGGVGWASYEIAVLP